jgi:mRNA interferase RelE/StbE
MYTLALRQSARKELDRLEDGAQRRIGLVFESLKANPFQGKELKGDLRGFRSVRVWPYRIIYEIRKHELIVFVVEISHRKDAYR